MKKLLRNIAILLLPILLYYAVFLALEPNNYFGLRAETPTGAAIGTLRAYERDPKNRIILGDSRMAHFDMDLVNSVAGGAEYANLSFMGASLEEELDRLDWVLENNPDLEEVVFGLSFYTLNQNYGASRTDGIEMALHNPFVYMTNLSFNLETLEQLSFFLQGKALYGGSAETSDPATYEYVPYAGRDGAGETQMIRQDIVEYIDLISVYTENWQLNTAQLDRLFASITTCAQRGILFVVVLPPMHSAIMEYSVRANGIEETMLTDVIAPLRASPAVVLDYEFTDRPDFADDMFYDGFHLDAQRGLPEWTEMLFGAIRDNQT